NVDKVAESNVGGEGNPSSQMEWFADGNTLVYASDSQNVDKPISVKVYHADTGKIQTVLTDLPIGDFMLFPSPNSRNLATYSYSNGLYLASLETQFTYRFRSNADSISWSPDGSMLAFRDFEALASVNVVSNNGAIVRHFERNMLVDTYGNAIQWVICP